MLNQDTGLLRRVVASLVVGLAVAIAVAAIVIFLTGRPTRRFAMAAGPEGGMYIQVAESLRDALAARGFRVEVVETAGSEENVELLRSGRALVGLVQSGTDAFTDMSGITALSELFYEPAWLFLNRKTTPAVDDADDLVGKRIGIGPDGSGTQEIALAFLQAEGIADQVTRVAEETDDTAAMLHQGEIDAAFFVLAPTAPLMDELVAADNLSIYNYPNAEALSRRYPSLSAVTLSRAVLDIPRDVPPADTQLVAARATLVGRADLHPDLARLLVESLPGVLPYPLVGSPAAFPSLAQTRFPVNDEARRYLAQGRTPLEDFLPFEIASPLSRWYLIVFPIIVLAFPLWEIGRATYVWWMNSRVIEHYPRIHRIERNLRRATLPELDEQLAYLRTLEERLPDRTKVTAGFLSSYFQLESHVAFVISRVEARRAQLLEGGAGDLAPAQEAGPAEVATVAGPAPTPQPSASETNT
jgi:TRAP transporter TAXI family solute receptor